jgi:hypothetical protein
MTTISGPTMDTTHLQIRQQLEAQLHRLVQRIGDAAGDPRVLPAGRLGGRDPIGAQTSRQRHLRRVLEVRQGDRRTAPGGAAHHDDLPALLDLS